MSEDVTAGCCGGGRFPSVTMSATMKFVTLNAKSCNLTHKRKKIALELTHIYNKIDILFLQETHLEEVNETKTAYFSHGTSAARGVAILLNGGDDLELMKINQEEYLKDDNGRIIAIGIICKGKKIGLINCYAPNLNDSKKVQEEYLAYLDDLSKILAELDNACDILIVGGDFNIALDKKLDAKGGKCRIYDVCVWRE